MKRIWAVLALIFLVAGLIGPTVSAQGPEPEATPPAPEASMGTADGMGIESLSGSFVEFDPSVGGDTCYSPGATQTFCFRAESFTDDWEYVYNLWQMFPTDWTVLDVYVQGTPACDSGASWGAFSWAFETSPYEVNISHARYQSSTDHCTAYYCFEVVSGGPGDPNPALESWYWDGDGYGSPPHNPCSDDGYTPPGQNTCDEAVEPRASIPPCSPLELTPPYQFHEGCACEEQDHELLAFNNDAIDVSLVLTYTVEGPGSGGGPPVVGPIPAGGSAPIPVILRLSACSMPSDVITMTIEAMAVETGITATAVIVKHNLGLGYWEWLPENEILGGLPADWWAMGDGIENYGEANQAWWMTGGVYGGTVSGQTWYWDWSTMAWVDGGVMPNAVYRTEGDVQNNDMYNVGGSTSGFTPQNYNQWHPDGGPWTAVAPAPSVSMDNVVEVWPSLFGGNDRSYLVGGYGMTPGAYEYDPVADSWATLAANPYTPIDYPVDGCFGYADDERTDPVIVQFPDTTSAQTNLLVYHIGSDSWEEWPVPDGLPSGGIWGHDIAMDYERNLCYITGGALAPGPGGLTTLYIYDPVANAAQQSTDFTTARDFHASWYYDDLLCVAGGADSAGNGLVSTQCAIWVECPPCDVTLESEKWAPAEALPGEVISYTIVLTVSGMEPGMEAMDPLPPDVEYAGGLTWTAGYAWYDAGANAVYWQPGPPMPPKGMRTPPAGTPNPDAPIPNVPLEISAEASNPAATIIPSANPEDVLWDQYANWSGTDMASQDFETAYDIYDIYAADDFENTEPWAIDTIVTRGGWGGFVDLNNADALNWWICPDNGGEPLCDPPGDGNEVWAISLPPNDPQVQLGVVEAEDVYLTLDSPVVLPPGTWWLVYQASLNYGSFGQYGWSSTDDTPWGHVGMQNNPGEGFGMGQGWWDNTYGYDFMFRLEGGIAQAPAITITFDVTVTGMCGDWIINEGDLVCGMYGSYFSATTAITGEPEIAVDPMELSAEFCPDGMDEQPLWICNVGDCPLDWALTEVPTVTWLSEDPLAGTVWMGECQTVTVFFDGTGVAPGEYYADLRIDSNDPDDPEVFVPVTMTVLQPAEILTVTTVITDLTVDFDATVAGEEPLYYHWAFGDGITDTVEDPVHVYDMGGCYTVTLDAWNDCGADMWQEVICVEEPCDPVELLAVNYDITDLTVDFDSEVTGTEPIAYEWDFGDGMDTLVRVGHASPNAPNVDVLIDGATVLSNVPFGAISNYLPVPAGDHLVQVIPTGGVDPVISATLILDPATDYSIVAIDVVTQITPLVLVDDNTTPAPGDAHVKFVHTSPDAPAVDVAVTGGPVLFSDVAFGEEQGPLPVPAGTYDLEVRLAGTFTVVLYLPDVQFDANHVYTVFAMGFAAGGPPPLQAVGAIYTMDPDPVHTYAEGGCYTVTLDVWNGCGMDMWSELICVCDPVEIVEVHTFIDGCMVDFVPELAGTEPFDFMWDFGAFGTSTEPTPTVDFEADGTYPYTLTAYNCEEGMDTYAGEVTVECGVCEPVYDADFDWVPLEPGIGQDVTFTGWASGTAPIAFSWDFGDGMTGTGRIIDHAYATTGTFTVTMTASNCETATMSVMHTINVVEEPACLPVEILTVTTEISGCAATFGAELGGDPPYEYMWDFGAYGTSTETMPYVDFGGDGTYPYMLTVYNCEGLYEDTYEGEVTVECGVCLPVTDTQFTWTPTMPEVDQDVNFTGWAQGSTPITFTWDFGDGATGMGAMVTHAYTAAGTYTVTLTATNCVTATQVVWDTVTVVEAVEEFTIYLPLITKNYTP